MMRWVVALGVFFPFLALATPVTLSQSYLAALRQSELIASQTEVINQAEEKYNQALAGVLPSINGSFSYQIQETNGLSGTGAQFFPGSQTTAKITATQPLFRGFREFSALKQTNRTADAEREARRQAEWQLYQDVAQSFLLVLSLDKQKQDFEQEITLNEKRIGEVEERIRIGRSRTSEALTLRSSLASSQAQVASLTGQLKAARELFAFLTGLKSESELKDLTDSPANLPPVDDFLKSRETRPDLKTLSFRLLAAEEGEWIAKGGHLPNVDLVGNYYLKRPGVLQNVHWDLAVQITLPIFQGGAILSQTREAVSRRTQSELALIRLRRQSEQDVRALHETVGAELIQLKSLEKAAELAEKNYREQSREYRLGLVTNVDVLLALTSYQQSVRALDQARYTLKLDWIKLQISSGRFTPPVREG